jgi:bromodomain-containing factor 1
MSSQEQHNANSSGQAHGPTFWTLDRKQELSNALGRLCELFLRRAIEVIRKGCPHFANVDDEEIEMDMDEINHETLRQLYELIVCQFLNTELVHRLNCWRSRAKV